MKLKLAFLISISIVFWSLSESTRRDKVKKKLLQSNRLSPTNEDGTDDRAVYEIGDQPEHHTPHCNLNGHWYNQHGSELFINHTDEVNFCGEYRTAVELEQSSQMSELMGQVRGKVVGKLLTFNVFWKNGESVVTWSGQCHKPCDMGYFSSDHTTLHTTWLMTSRVESCDRHWMSTRTGQDIFTRDSTIKDGPRRGSNSQRM